jgi:HEAT repeat protein
MRSLGRSRAGARVVACLLAAAFAPAFGAEAIDKMEPQITVSGAEGDYLRTLHAQIHFRWVTKFIETIAMARPARDPLNDPHLQTEVLFTVRWDGSAAEATVSKGSGNATFDQYAIASVRSEIRYPVPPLQVFGDDGVAHFHWTLARDQRLCSGGEVRRREDPLEEALPRLFYQGRTKEALLRVARYMREGDSNAMSTFARAWLGRRFSDPVADVRAAAALAQVGDRRQVDRLRAGLGRSDTVAISAQALSALKIDVCTLVAPSLRAGDPAAAELAAHALIESHAEQPPTSPCVAALTDLVKDPAVPARVRAEMIAALAAVNPGNVRHMLLGMLEDPDAHIRAAAARSFARPGGGRPTLYRLQPLLKDPSPEVRAAVAAGLVRSTGEIAFEYLQPVLKENDMQPMLAMADELGRQSSSASVDLLAKLLKRNVPELRMAVMAALAERRDAPARALFQPLAVAVRKDPRASNQARLVAFSGADVDELLPLAKDPVMGLPAYRAMLAARRHQEAADWLVGSFDRMAPDETLVDAFAAWLANPPGRVAVKSARADR